MEINYENFGQEDFTFPGMYRAIVEDNADPREIGRVRIRIFGIHSFDEEDTPVEHLPWAEPCLSLYYSGGKNLDNKRDDPEKRYRPSGESNQELCWNTKELQEEMVDDTTKGCGSGAIYTTPQKGTQVWIFFENGDHTRPMFFAAAPKKLDWEKQREKLENVIKHKRDIVDELRDKFENDEYTKEHKGANNPVSEAKLKEINEKPKLNIFDIEGIENEHITSYTSPGGVTHIIVNKKGNERHYLVHKGLIEYTDHNGQCKRLVGKFKDSAMQVEKEKHDGNSSDHNDFQEAISNNYELHIGGDFETHILKSQSVQIDGDMQVNVGKNISFVSREGNVNIMVEKGDCNLSVSEGKVNTYCKDNLQINTDSDAQVNVGGNAVINTKGNIDFKAGGNITFQAGGKLSFSSGGSSSFKCSDFSVSGSSMQVSCGSSFAVNGAGIGTDKACEANLFKGVHPGLKVVGDARLINDVPSPKSASPSSPNSASSVSFAKGATTTIQDPNDPSFVDPGE